MQTSTNAVPRSRECMVIEHGRYLDDASLQLSPVQRLEEAAGNIWYALKDFGDVEDEVRHHLDVTPVHEAGHAVAYTLIGWDVKDVRCGSLLQPLMRVRDRAMGQVRLEGNTGPNDCRVAIRNRGAQGMARDIVATYAGVIAEIGYDPRRAAGGHREDSGIAENNCKTFAFLGLAERYELQNWAWRETCRMIADKSVWAAVIEIACRLKGSTSTPARVSGGAVRTIVRRHLPNGWEWSDAPLNADAVAALEAA